MTRPSLRDLHDQIKYLKTMIQSNIAGHNQEYSGSSGEFRLENALWELAQLAMQVQAIILDTRTRADY